MAATLMGPRAAALAAAPMAARSASLTWHNTEAMLVTELGRCSSACRLCELWRLTWLW